MKNRLRLSTILYLSLLGIISCAGAQQSVVDEAHLDDGREAFEVAEVEAEEEVEETVEMGEKVAPESPTYGGQIRLEPSTPFRQISWMMTDADDSDVEYRVLTPLGKWTEWQTVEISFSEGRSYNARVLLDFSAEVVELRGGEHLHRAHFSMQPRITARPLDVERLDDEPDEGPTELEPATLPADMVVGRHQWGAIEPDLICRDVVDPYRVSFHHTFMPGDDGEDAAQRVRQIQSFHIYERGWCDIGYHFLIAQDGQIYRGRSQSNRPGAHVGGQNGGNIGIGFIGDFSERAPDELQLESAALLTRWIHETYAVPLTRRAIRGHREWPGQTTGCPGALTDDDGFDSIGYILDRAHDVELDSGDPSLIVGALLD